MQSAKLEVTKNISNVQIFKPPVSVKTGWNVEIGCEYHGPYVNIDTIDPSIGYWIAGWFCGEGSFRLKYEHKPTRGTFATGITMGLRDDDTEPLEIIHDTLNLKESIRIFSNQRRRNLGEKCGNEIKLNIYDVETIYHKFIPLFRRFPIKGIKGQEFAIFARAIEIIHHKITEGRRRKPYYDHERDEIISLIQKLSKSRKHPVFGSSKENRTSLRS